MGDVTVPDLLDNFRFILERLTWLNAVDILLVTLVFFGILRILRGTQAVTLLRGVLLLIVLFGFLTSFELLPAFSWFLERAIPAMIIAIPVIFAPEIRRALERLGRASAIFPSGNASKGIQDVIGIVVQAAATLSVQRHGALIVMQRLDGLQEHIETGILLNAQVSDKLLTQVFYPNTPLHDGAVILADDRLVAATCVLPLASGDIQALLPGRQIGLRHRAAIGISEVSDAVAIVVSEETGAIAVTSGGRIIRRLDASRLENILTAFYRPLRPRQGINGLLTRLFQGRKSV